jgi:uncharacterized membrane protein YcaP (DUF421 family)
MNLDFIWQTIIIFIIGNFLLRLGGRRAIAQMTSTQVTIMIGFGTLLVSPLTNKSITETFLILLILVILMIIFEYLETKCDLFEKTITGKSIMIIENGKPNMDNLKKIRMSIDKLEMRLREYSISSIEDVKYATIEANGKLGYKLKMEKEPATKSDIDNLIMEIQKLQRKINVIDNNKKIKNKSKNNIFKEIKNKSFEGNINEP